MSRLVWAVGASDCSPTSAVVEVALVVLTGLSADKMGTLDIEFTRDWGIVGLFIDHWLSLVAKVAVVPFAAR
jgi:hypothetical protein